MADQPDNIFASQPATQPPVQPANPAPAGAQDSVNEFTTLLSSIKNERGEQKYATLADALVGLKNAQEFIPSLQAKQAEKDAEIERLRKEAERVQTLEETLAAFTSQRNEQNQPTAAPAFDENKLADLVNRTLTQREQAVVAQQNLASVVSTLQQSFGADAEAKFYGKADELGLSKVEINTLASKNPKAVLAMLGVSNQAPKQANTNPPPGSFNSSAYTPNEQTSIGRNPKQALVGATTEEVRESSERAKKMVDELHSKGMSVHDLSDPKMYAKFFK